RDGAHRRMGARQPGERAVDAAEEGHQRRAVPGVLQADQPRSGAAARLVAQPRGRRERIHAAAVYPGEGAVRPVEPRQGRRREALRAARVHHGRRPGADACVPALRARRDRLGRPAAQRQPRTAAGSRDVKAIREGSTKRVLAMLEDLAKGEDPSKFGNFHAEFGAVLKEGLGEDFANRDRIAKLLRFASTQSDSVSVSLADYKARMKEGQEAIYYIT